MTTTQQRIERLLRTTQGERVMRPTYGSQLYKLVDQRRDENWVRDLSHYTYQAIRESEPSIKITKVSVEINNQKANVIIECQNETVNLLI